ncbi:MAG: lamin tail domain-containing protein [Candidatus Acetothermia bacterium]|nr:lamin tail domain-containing protein [Candidatus Acetothermia bacterium]MDH7504540.1 lamin tail domain-containing protein [Candidatus Acetothermia bacterium]
MRARRSTILLAALALGICLLGGAREEWSPTVVINEVGWMGTAANSADEWIELYNPTDYGFDLSGWTLSWSEGEVTIYFSEVAGNTKEIRRSVIPARGFYILERTDDTTISDIEADLIYKGSLDNAGGTIILRDAAGRVVDTANGDGGEWPAGTASRGEPPYASMERINPALPDADANWGSNNGEIRNGLDAEGNPINGTPGRRNSASGG